MMILLYSLVLTVGLTVSAPWWLYRMATTQRYRDGLWERLGRVPTSLAEVIREREVVWLHAVSVGEMLAASRLVADLEEKLGDGFRVVISTTTRTGRNLARERFGAERVFYIPLDFAWPVRRYLRVLRPRVLVLMESELWPRLLYECARRGVPIAVANARVSDRSYKRSRSVPAVWTRALRKVSMWFAQTDEDARRLAAMGVRAEAVQVAGNLKYDVRAPKQSRIAELIRTGAAERKIVVAGSTVNAKPASEEQIFMQESMGPVWQSFPETLLVIAPRHPDHFDEVVKLAKEFGAAVRATDLLQRGDGVVLREKIVVLDTIGDLAAVYGIADAAFVGGSLVKHGGHNPLEPAQFGVPVVMGPFYENFRDIVAQMKAANGICIAKDGFEVHEVLLNLLGKKLSDRETGERGREVFEQQQGATERTATALVEMIRAGART